VSTIAFIGKSHVIKNIGGAEVQTDILAKSMADAGWNVVYVTSAINRIKYFNNYKLVPAPTTKNRFKEFLSGIDADIYYQRGRKELTGWVGEFCRDSGKKFVFATSMDIDCFKHKYLFRSSGSIADIIKQAISFKRSRILDKESLRGMKQANLILTQTNHQRNAMKANLGIDSKVFYNVHEMPDHKNKISKDNDSPVILWLANLKEWKQPELFLQLAQDMREAKCKFLMAGGVKSGKYERLIKKTREVNSNFDYLGPVSFEESNSLFLRANVFVNTSKAQEGFPNTFIQAWMQGVPTISLDFDPDNLIVREKMGMVANNNYSNLKDAVSLILQDANLRKRYSESARKFAMNNFCKKNKINEFINLLNDQINGDT
jgi:glycosyltransferase involved in cell wall biosynthesis